MSKNSLGSVLLDRACQDPEAWKKLSAAVHRTQLWAYRNGKTKPNADTIAAIASTCPDVTADAWGQPPPKRTKALKPVAVDPTEAPEADKGAA